MLIGVPTPEFPDDDKTRRGPAGRDAHRNRGRELVRQRWAHARGETDTAPEAAAVNPATLNQLAGALR